jgi:hypothetical protein
VFAIVVNAKIKIRTILWFAKREVYSEPVELWGTDRFLECPALVFPLTHRHSILKKKPQLSNTIRE